MSKTKTLKELYDEYTAKLGSSSLAKGKLAKLFKVSESMIWKYLQGTKPNVLRMDIAKRRGIAPWWKGEKNAESKGNG